MTVMAYQDILQLARRLPSQAQHKLVEDLLQPNSLSDAATATSTVLRPLLGFTTDELSTLAHSILAPQQQERIYELLDKRRGFASTDHDDEELDALLAEADRVALLKARALYTLQIKQQTG